MIIHPNKEAALRALSEYREEMKSLAALEERLGIRIECEDSCCAIYTTVQFYADDGKTVCSISE